MLANEVINILNNQVHPEHTKIANDVSTFLSNGIFALSFQIMMISPTPGEDRRSKHLELMHALFESNPDAINTAIKFIQDSKNEFSVAFTDFIKRNIPNRNNINLKI